MNASIKLNQNLIRTLGNVLGVSPEVIWESAGIARSTWYHIMKNPADISVRQLLSIANGQKIPVRRFFYTGQEGTVGKREDYVMEPYIECFYDGDVLREVVNSRSDATWQKAAKVVGITPTRLRNSLLAITRTPVSRFLMVCRTFDVDPFDVLIDRNVERRKGGRHTAAFTEEINDLRQQVSFVNAAAADLMGRYDSLSVKYEDLLSKYDRLLDAHRQLLQQFGGSADGEVAADR